MAPTRNEIVQREQGGFDNFNAGIPDYGPYAEDTHLVHTAMGIFVGKDEIVAVLTESATKRNTKFDRTAGPDIVTDVAPGIHAVASEFVRSTDNGAGGRVAFGVRVINFFNDNLEATRSVSVPINSADKVAIKELRTRIDGGSPRGGAEAKAALSKLVNLTNAADLAGFTDALADNAIWIAPWFKVCRGKEACMALAKSVFEGGLKSVKMLGEPDSFTPFTAVVGTEWMNEGLFPVKTTQSLYMVSLEPPSGKIARVANYPEDLKDVETMRMQYNKDYANAAESA